MPAIHATSPTLAAVWLSLLRFLPYALFAGLGTLSLYFSPSGVPAVLQLMQAVLLFTLSYGILHSLLRRTFQVEGVVPTDRHTSHKLYFWTRLLIAATLVGIIFHSPLLDSAQLASTAPNNLVGLIRIVVGTLTGFALARLIWLMSKPLPVYPA